MVETLYEVFDTQTGQIYATKMQKEDALIFIGALFDHYYNDITLSLGVRLEGTIRALSEESSEK